MTNTVTLPAVFQTFALALDSVSTNFSIADRCGPIDYSIVEAYTFLTVTAGSISLVSNSMADIRSYTATLQAKLTNYSAV
jgi:hypothetical protein